MSKSVKTPAQKEKTDRNIQEAADRLRISRRSLQHWESGRILPVYPAQVGALHLLAGKIISKPPGI